MRLSKFKHKAQTTQTFFRTPHKWKQDTREQLLASIRTSTTWKQAQHVDEGITFKQLFQGYFVKNLLNPAIAVVLVFALVSYGSVSTVQAARASLPGDALYSVKLGFEQAKVGATFSESKKAKLEISFATTRLKEVHDILEKENSDSLEKTKKSTKEDKKSVNTDISKAIRRFNQDVGSVQKRLEKIEKEEKSEEKVLKISKLVNETTDELVEDLLVIKEKIVERSVVATEVIDAQKAPEITKQEIVEIEKEFQGSEVLDKSSVIEEVISQTEELFIEADDSQKLQVLDLKDENAKDHQAQNVENVALNIQISDQDTDDLLESLDGAILVADDANSKSLEVFVDKAATSSNQEVKQDAVEKIQKKIKKIAKGVELAEEKIEKVKAGADEDGNLEAERSQEDAVATKEQKTEVKETGQEKSNIVDNASSVSQESQGKESIQKDNILDDSKLQIKEPESIGQAIEKTKEKPKQVKEAINEVRKILDQDGTSQLGEAMEKIIQANTDIKQADKDIAEVADEIFKIKENQEVNHQNTEIDNSSTSDTIELEDNHEQDVGTSQESNELSEETIEKEEDQ